MREKMNRRFDELHEKILKMSVIVEENVDKSFRSVLNKDRHLAKEVIDMDSEVNFYEKLIEGLCIELIATQSPLAKDLREIFSIMKVITDLERIGDHCVNISEAILKIEEKEYVKPLVDMEKMAKIVKAMIYGSINAFIDKDVNKAVETAVRDDEVDALYENIYSDLLEALAEKPQLKNQIITLLLIGRYLERIADHATNICERTIYMITGENVKY